MTGQGPQPGGRQAAPGELALVQAFINSHYDLEIDHGADLFATPAALGEWLIERELMLPGARSLTGGELRRAVAMREGLRELAKANGGADAAPQPGALKAVNEAALGAVVEVRFGRDGPRFTADRSTLDGALGMVVAIAARAMVDGTWSRLKVCPGEDCGWVFYDHSRNQSGRWCSMAVCGGRSKALAYYRRRRGPD